MKDKFRYTINACFLGYIVQAIINNFVPLLFLTFKREFGIPLSKITFLITMNFAIQLFVDLLSAKLIDKIGYRVSIVTAHFACAIGLAGLTVLPDMLGNAYVGIIISVIIYAVGGGLLEVLVSPIVESCPSDNKEAQMSLLHSFYCWGHVGVVLISTAFFAAFGISFWRVLAIIWAIIPVINGFVFTKVPLASLVEEGKGLSVSALLKNKSFWLFVVMMICAGASEQAVSQWASAFAEQGLGVSKSVGDLAGTMMFAVLMGSARAFYGKLGAKINLDRFMIFSALLCITAYLVISLVKSPVICLIGCAICGLSVGIMWPGTFSKASAGIKNGGTAMFALLALGGDLGCSAGPSLVGAVSSHMGDNMKMGFLAATIFPSLLLVGVLLLKGKKSYL